MNETERRDGQSGDLTGELLAEMYRNVTMGAETLQDRLEEFEARGCSEESAELCRDILTFEEEEVIRAEHMSRQMES